MRRSWQFDLCEVASELVVCKSPGLCSVTRCTHTAQAAWPWPWVRRCSNRNLSAEKGRAEVCSSHLGLFPSPLQRRPFGGNSQRTVLCGSLGLLDNDGGLRIPTCRAQGIDSRGWSLSDTAASSTREAVCVASLCGQSGRGLFG